MTASLAINHDSKIISYARTQLVVLSDKLGVGDVSLQHLNFLDGQMWAHKEEQTWVLSEPATSSTLLVGIDLWS